MIGHINPKGELFIERGNDAKRQHCPKNFLLACGDWCPLFGEPIELTDGRTIIEICDCKSLCFNIFDDCRPETTEDEQ